MEEEDPYSWNKKITGETARTVREANLLKRKFALNQKELLHFVNNLEFFVGVSVEIEKMFVNKRIGYR